MKVTEIHEDQIHRKFEVENIKGSICKALIEAKVPEIGEEHEFLDNYMVICRSANMNEDGKSAIIYITYEYQKPETESSEVN